MGKTENLIEKIAADPASTQLGELSNALADEYRRGASPSTLIELLQSPDDRLADVGAWVASEMGQVGEPLLPFVRPLLGHRSKKVRFWAVECIHMWAGPSDGGDLAAAAELIDDPEEAVRWKAMMFLGTASLDQIRFASRWFTRFSPSSPISDDLQWLIHVVASDTSAIAEGLRGADSRHRRFAVVAAGRIAGENPEPLRRARENDDPEIVQFATDFVDRIRL